MWTIIFLGLYIIVAFFIVLSLLLHGAKPSKTLAWLLAIFTIPVGGILLYILVGRNRRKNKLLKRKRISFLNSFDSLVGNEENSSWKHKKLMRLIHQNCNFPVTRNNRLYTLKNGKTTFESIFEALNKAKNQIHLQYYIFEEGELANRLLRLFQSKITKGVNPT